LIINWIYFLKQVCEECKCIKWYTYIEAVLDSRTEDSSLEEPKMHQILGGQGFAPNTTGEAYKAPTNSLAGEKRR